VDWSECDSVSAYVRLLQITMGLRLRAGISVLHKRWSVRIVHKWLAVTLKQWRWMRSMVDYVVVCSRHDQGSSTYIT
jgi:hypothetical protein